MAQQRAIIFTTAIPPSVNHAYQTTREGKRVLTGAAKRWYVDAKTIAAIAAKEQGWTFNTGNKLVMKLWVFWPDERRRDTHNLHKLIADAFEGVLYKDDKMLLIRDMDFQVDRKCPRVVIAVTTKKEIQATKIGSVSL